MYNSNMLVYVMCIVFALSTGWQNAMLAYTVLGSPIGQKIDMWSNDLTKSDAYLWGNHEKGFICNDMFKEHYLYVCIHIYMCIYIYIYIY